MSNILIKLQLMSGLKSTIKCKNILKSLVRNGRKMSTNWPTIENKSNNYEFFKRLGKLNRVGGKGKSKELNEMEFTRYEQDFQELRSEQLVTIDCNQYKQWLTQLCFHLNDTPLGYQQKFDKIQTICRLYNQLLDTSATVPIALTTKLMHNLLNVESEAELIHQIQYFYALELKKWIEKELRKQDILQNKIRLDLKNFGNKSRIGLYSDRNELIYGLWHNCLFTRISRNYGRKLITKTRLKTAALFGQKICFDFGFEEYLNLIGAKQLTSYLVKTFEFNRQVLKDSYDLSFCNLNPTGNVTKLLEQYFNGHSTLENYINTTSKSYLDEYDFDKLCYICPQAEEPLQTYDHNAIYVLPAVVQYRMDPPLSMMRVRLEGIQMKRIPIEEYAPIREGFCLEVFNSLQILSHFREHNDMSKAVSLYLPKTVRKSTEEVEEADEEVAKRAFYTRMLAAQHKTKIYRKID